MKNDKTMLIFGFKEEERQKINEIISKNELPNYKVIDEDMAKMKIKEILEGFKFQLYTGSLPKEKAILFNNFNDNELDIAIKAIKGNFPQIIMAVVTPTSIEWSFEELLKHLIEEREFYKR